MMLIVWLGSTFVKIRSKVICPVAIESLGDCSFVCHRTALLPDVGEFGLFLCPLYLDFYLECVPIYDFR